MQYTHYNSEQYLFDRNLGGLWGFGKLLLKALLYTPLLITGYVLSDLVLHKKDAAVLWMTTIVGFAFALFLFIYFLKGMIVALLKAGNFLWVPIFLLCIVFVCIVPAWIVFRSTDGFMMRVSADSGRIFTWITGAVAAILSYRRYNFLTDNAPGLALPLYRVGYWLAKRLT
jgi:hypothetical protein